MFTTIRLVGNLGSDVQQSKHLTNGGQPIVFFSLAVNRTWRDQGEQRHQETTWFRVTVTGELAKTCLYLKKGQQVFIVSHQIKATGYKTNDGPRSQIDLMASEVIPLGQSGRQMSGYAGPEEVWGF